MQNSTMKKLDTASNQGNSRMIRMKNGIKIIVTGALLLAASSAMAGIIFLPAGGQYTKPELAPVSIQSLGGESFRINTTGLTGELTVQGSDFPPECDIATTERLVLPFDQTLELVINLSLGVVEGRSSGQIHVNNKNPFVIDGRCTDADELEFIRLDADVQGKAICLPLNGLECGQLVVDLELRGVLSNPNDPSIVGQQRMNVLGSLIFDGSDVGLGLWAAMSANATIGGNERFIKALGVADGDVDGHDFLAWQQN